MLGQPIPLILLSNCKDKLFLSVLVLDYHVKKKSGFTHHFTIGVGKPSTVQKSLIWVFSNTVWDLSLARNFGPLIIGSSRTYLSAIFVLTYTGQQEYQQILSKG